MSTPRPQARRTTTLAEVAHELGLTAPLPEVTGRTAVTGVTLDSRAVRPGDLYAALPGSRAHGASFAGAAAASGARAVLTDEAGAALLDEQACPLPRLVVPGPRAVLGRVASVVYGTSGSPVRLVGVTGTNGKTTTAYLLTSALEALGLTTGMIGTVEIRVGDQRIKSVRTTPEAPDLHALLAVMAERAVDTCVMEVSSHALSLHRVDGVVYDVAMFTNLSQDHLDFHPDMEDYFAAKASLFTPERSRRGVVCVDDEWGRRLAAEAGVPVVTVSTHGAPATWAVVPVAGDPASFTLRGEGRTLRLRSALPGPFNVTNTAMAAVALLELGHDGAAVEAAVLADPHVPGRMEVVRHPDRTDLPVGIIDYAHTPDAVEAALSALRPATRGIVVAVLGAGGDRDRGKRTAMGAAGARGADVLVVTDDNPRSEPPHAIRDAVLAGARAAAAGTDLHVVEDRARAIRVAVAAAVAGGPGSIVAVLGKGHETGQEIAGVVHPFDDREELACALDEAAEEVTSP